MLIVEAPNFCKHEIEYICFVIFKELLPTEYQLIFSDVQNFYLKYSETNNVLILKCEFFNTAKSNILSTSNFPQLPLKEWDISQEPFACCAISNNIPVIYGSPGIERGVTETKLNLDVFGSVFFMLSRYEEYCITEKDAHGRFRADLSLSMKGGFLERPIVDEYIAILGYNLKAQFPDIKIEDKTFEKVITCDTDWPFAPHLENISAALRKSVFELIKEKSIKNSLCTMSKYLYAKVCKKYKDEHREALSWLLNENELYGNKVGFYFIPLNTSKLDNDEDFGSERMRSLLLEINDRGHEIGFHPGYQTFEDKKLFDLSAKKMFSVLDELNITQQNFGGRQHFLRWNTVCTPKYWEDAGFQYDSSLAFAEKSGFRAGTCHEYTMYDLKERRKLNLKQRPLICMEDTIISDRYEAFGLGDRALQRFLDFKSICKKYRGKYTLLWHNCRLVNEREREIYTQLIR